MADKKEELQCTAVAEILSVPCDVEKELESLFELEQRISINKHLKECTNSKCNQMRIDRINSGLY